MKFIAVLMVFVLAACSTEIGKDRGGGTAAAKAVSVTGELKSASSHYFGPPAIPDVWNYTISFMATDGMVVAKDTPILRFDTQELKTQMRDKNNMLNEKQKELEKAQIISREQLAELRLLVEEARASLDKARLKADIPESLLASRDYREYQLLLKQAELNLALRKEELSKEEKIQLTEIRILEREVGVLQVEADQLADSIASMTIKAPGEGVVIHAVDRRNNKMSVGDNVWMGRRVMEFPDLSRLEAHLEIPERESARVNVGQTVRITLDAAPDRQFLGEITELASVIHTRSVNQPDKIFDAKVMLKDPDTKLMRPGMSINADILVEAAKGP